MLVRDVTDNDYYKELLNKNREDTDYVEYLRDFQSRSSFESTR